MDTNILLESGTNELELLEFEVGTNVFGINIAKVVEIMIDQEVTPVPNAPPELEGVFIPRDKLISVIDLHKVVKAANIEDNKNIFIICEFNNMTVAFHVTKVKGIQRISWSDISDPPEIAGNGNDVAMGLSTGIAKIKDRIIIIMDFEKIVSKLNREAGLDMRGLEKIKTLNYSTGKKRLVVADDSKFLNRLINDALSKIGFSNIESFTNGQDAYNYVNSFRNKEGAITDHIACVISDIEMPQMDGHRLTKLIKDDKILNEIPVLLFSSLINEQMVAKCRSVGADGQFSKPQISELIQKLIELVS
ncbi:MAG: chemotaxis protein [Oscillospiraceae bacterium]|nr:chemotaxis protein [Oscillospiraceae bacterium]